MLDMTAALAQARAVSDPAAQVGAITGLMAGAMVEMAGSGIGCSAADLSAYGFSAAEILEFGGDAKTLAAAKSVRQIDRPEVIGPKETYAALEALRDLADRHGAGLDREGAAIMRRAARALDNLHFVFDLAA